MKRILFHPLASARWKIFWNKYRSHRPHNRESRLESWISIVSVLVRTPFYWLEDRIYGRRLAAREIEDGPIFIVGHWRSGTTHLHNLLSQDEELAYLSFSNMVMPHDMLLGRYLPVIPFILKMILPKTRGIDRLPLKPHLPQEEEMALGMLNAVSYYNCYFFPKQWKKYYDESIAMEGLDDAQRRGFEEAYRKLVVKLSYLKRGKRLILKNPSSSARMVMLKRIFPNAKFVHIRRNPYAVFSSSRARMIQLVGFFSVHDAAGFDYDRATLDSYRILMERYFEQRDQVPQDDLFETSYEELTADPEKVVGDIYAKFGLKRSDAAARRLSEYVGSQKSYRKNEHRLTRSQIERIDSEWAFAFKEWDYALPPDLEIVD